MNPIETHSLTKRYGETTALDSLEMSIENGEVFGFLGPNGSGKSTTIDILLGFIYPTSGSASVFGIDPTENVTAIRQRTGVVPDGYEVMPDWTGRDHVEFELDSRNVDDDPDALLDRFGLLEDADRVATGYSRGMRQRLLLSMAAAGEPDLLLLDEPTTGLDPNGIRLMREFIRDERARGATIFFSSHRLAQVESVCDRVGILNEGSLLAIDSIDSLRNAVGDNTILQVSVDHVPDDIDSLTTLDGIENLEVSGTTLRVQCAHGRHLDALNHLDRLGATPQRFETETASLEDIFSAYTESETESSESVVESPVETPL
ncbi:ABC transporter ATP-binding protein [Halogeometricum borinquense]|uniref:ABC transporter ATP-binding protein n=1 Tax=Halogeometricum borinquense TaxID=60847 RepID=A0A482T0P1_9EURY|nr:ABC transporter ATP-binding protein [Halogeometricum borinquense]RYJ08506.1 ABC transporter ATP-binding protein [Halogeometricum borinquense]